VEREEFDELIGTLTEWVEACRQDRLFTKDDMAKVFNAILRVNRLGSEFNSLTLLPETIHRGAFDDALRLLNTLVDAYRAGRHA
jgi:hypothetical protein